MFAAILLVTGLGPVAARASDHPILVQSAMPIASESFDRNKAFAIGAGILVGAAAGSALSLRGAVIIGAVAGGLIGAWWYGDSSEFATLEPRQK
jgi:outer membrane lipoprotein SlyB